MRDETRSPGKAPLPYATVAWVLERTLGEPPGKTVHAILDNYATDKHL